MRKKITRELEETLQSLFSDPVGFAENFAIQYDLPLDNICIEECLLLIAEFSNNPELAEDFILRYDLPPDVDIKECLPTIEKIVTGNLKQTRYNKRKNIKNKTKAILRFEQRGLTASTNGFSYYHIQDMKDGVVRMVLPNPEGGYSFRRVICCMIDKEQLVPVHEYTYPEAIFNDETKFISFDAEHRNTTIRFLNNLSCLIYNWDEVDNGWEQYSKKILKMMDVSPIAATSPLKKTFYFPREFYGGLYGGGYTASREHAYYITPTFPPKIIKREYEGGNVGTGIITAEYSYENDQAIRHWNPYNNNFFVSDDKVICISKKSFRHSPQDIIVDIRFFDLELNLKRCVEVKTENYYPSCFTYSEEHDAVYFGEFAINLKDNRILKPDIPINGSVQQLFDKNGNIIVLSKSFVMLLDKDLNMISKHKLKGQIRYFYKNEMNNLCFVTSNSDACSNSTFPASDDCVRIYEIE